MQLQNPLKGSPSSDKIKNFSAAQSCPNLCDPMDCSMQASLSITNYQNLLKLMSIESVMPSNHLIFSCPLLLLPQSFAASGSSQMSQFFTPGGQRIGALALASVLPMNTQDWFPLGWTCLISFAVQGTFRSLLKHRSSKASILWHSAFFMVQLSQPYMLLAFGKIIPLTRQNFVVKVMSLLFNMLSSLK